MRSLRGCGATAACTTMAVAAALAVPGVASAKKGNPNQCSGSDITGQGAAVEKIAVSSIWSPDFNSSSDPAACSGTQGDGKAPTVGYNSTSSGLGLESWGVGGGSASFGEGNAFVGTEEPPNATAASQIEANETTHVAGTVQTIPVAQESIILIVHLPSGCKASSSFDSGRLVLNNETLDGIWNGTITEWSQITDDSDKLSGESCNASSPITRVVREDPAGTTHILKKYLALIDTSKFEVEGGGPEQSWNEISEGSGNTLWPVGKTTVVKPTKTGDTAEIDLVASTAGSIGFASLADTRAISQWYPPSGGSGTAFFWTPIQNNGIKTAKPTPKYADPSSNGESSTKAEANCESTKYTNGAGTKFPPKTTGSNWSSVTTSTTEKNYPLCGIAYDLALSSYSAYPGTTPGEAQTVGDFFKFVLSTGPDGGQTLLAGNDYEPLPTKLDKEALKGADLIKD
jgi:ABC-type phosphate transport system substrate-binding protein